MSDETTTSVPATPAASLLFQAPTFQEPTFQSAPPARSPKGESVTPSQGGGKNSRLRRGTSGRGREDASKTDSDGFVEGEEEGYSSADSAPATPTTRRSRSRKTSSDEGAERGGKEDTDSAAPSEEEGTSRKRRTRTRASRTREDALPPVDDTPAGQQDLDAAEEAGDNSAETPVEESGVGRRRRRRPRSTTGEDSADPADEVRALKGSTRLEAKKQRRREGRGQGRRRLGLSESEFLARRESVTRRMVIRHRDGLDQIAVLEDDLLVEHYVARRTQASMVGNIYMGRVQNVLPSMEAAFVDIGRGRNAVLYAGEVNWDAVGLEGQPRRIESALKSGDPVLVQVTKDPIGHKGARLTSQVTLAGRYLVLIPGGSMMGISRKLPDKERLRLKKILRSVVPPEAGVIVRTAAEGATEEQISQDVARLTKQWEEIEEKKTRNKNAPFLLRGEPELAVRVVRDIFNEDFTSLVIEGRETYQTVKDYVTELSPELAERVEQWVGTDDVFAAHRVDEQLAKGMDRKVWLPSGGSLIIDRTEAMTVIDVNTGKFIGAGGTLEETVTRNNLEAAEEIVRQLRLRDIGGIVIVDFVDMVLESNRDLVLRRLVECLGRDRTRHQVTEITSLGLVQMTRKRVGEGLVEAFSTTCQACEGRGFIVHHHPVEHAGSHAAPQGTSTKSSKRKKTQVEPRRIEEGPEREKAREALTAIAAASSHNVTEGEADGDLPASSSLSEENKQEDEVVTTATTTREEPSSSSPRGTRRAGRTRKSARSLTEPSAGVEGEDTPEEPVKADLSVRKTRRRRVVSMGSGEPTAAEKIAAVLGPTTGETQDSSELDTSMDMPANVSVDTPAPSDSPAIVSSTKDRPRRRRRVASTGVVDTN